MTTTSSAADLAKTFDALQEEAAALVAGCSEQQWQQTTLAENWTVAATAHHLAAVQQAFVGIVEQFAASNTYSPNMDMDDVHRSNAEHAREFAAADRDETLGILESSGAEMGALIRGLDDEDLDRLGGTFGDNDLTVGQFIEYVVIGHAREHTTSMQQTLAD